MAIVDGKIRCSKCQESKPTSEFQPAIVKRGCGECRPCKYVSKRNWEKENPEKVNEARRLFRDRNIDRHRAVTKVWRYKNKEKTKCYNLRRYGISLEIYNQMLADQSGRCAICSSKDPGSKRTSFFFVDHCHDTGTVRGLLCHHCNSGLSKFSDNSVTLMSAIRYLNSGRRASFKVREKLIKKGINK
jgi:hypothetical protein